jgi:hypothetical protein
VTAIIAKREADGAVARADSTGWRKAFTLVVLRIIVALAGLEGITAPYAGRFRSWPLLYGFAVFAIAVFVALKRLSGVEQVTVIGVVLG